MPHHEKQPSENSIADWLTWQRDPVAMRIQAQELAPHFEPRHWSFAPTAKIGTDYILLITRGEADISLAESGTGEKRPAENGMVENVRRAIAPTLVWVADGAAERLVLRAGASATLLAIRRDLTAQTFRQMPEAAELAPLLSASRPLLLEIVETDIEMLVRTHSALRLELAALRSGVETMITSLLAINFVQILRQIGPSNPIDETGGEPAAILKRFRQLVEAHFREAWPIARYATTLGCTPDRLHAICTRTLGRAPSVLIRQRILYESVTRLERSEVSVKQLAFLLGFSDTSYFNRFFARHIGVPPARYRREHNRRRPSQTAPQSGFSFADWP